MINHQLTKIEYMYGTYHATSKMPDGVELIDQTCSVSNNRDLETKKTNLLHYLDHLLFIPETENAEKGHKLYKTNTPS